MTTKNYIFEKKPPRINIFVKYILVILLTITLPTAIIGSVDMNSLDGFKSGFNGGIFFSSKEYTSVSNKMLIKTASHKKIPNQNHIKSITFSENPFDNKIELTYHNNNMNTNQSAYANSDNQLSFKSIATSLK